MLARPPDRLSSTVFVSRRARMRVAKLSLQRRNFSVLSAYLSSKLVSPHRKDHRKTTLLWCTVLMVNAFANLATSTNWSIISNHVTTFAGGACFFTSTSIVHSCFLRIYNFSVWRRLAWRTNFVVEFIMGNLQISNLRVQQIPEHLENFNPNSIIPLIVI